MEDCPSQETSELTLLQCQVVNHLLELIENSNKRNFVNRSKVEDKVKNLEAKLLNVNIGIEAVKAQLKESERENRQKAKLLEESEEKLEKLSRRLAACPWTPYAITQKHHFNEQPGVHDCLCVICGEDMKLHSSSHNSPEVPAYESSVVQSDQRSSGAMERIRSLEEEVRQLTERNATLQRFEVERLSKESFEEQLVLNSKTFGLLLEQAEQMAQDYDDLKEKYMALEIKYNDTCTKHEVEVKDLWTREQEALEKVIEQVNALERKEELKEQNEIGLEIDKHYKSIIELKKVQMEKLEGDLSQAERQINILKENRKAAIDNSDKTLDDIIKKEIRDSDKVKRLIELVQQKKEELTNERQMQEMWISELEVASKAYEQEKSYGKTMAKEVKGWCNE
jgi:DNA repair exonuclease SbcCD ATPase subunit